MLECEVCHKSFRRRPLLTQHYLTHVTERRFLCDFCPKKFHRRPDLRRHLRMHTGEKPFVCDVCQRGFGERCALDRHSKTHGGEKEFACELCDRRFHQKGDLDKHVLTQHGEKSFQCKSCEKRFALRSRLESHMWIHSGTGKPHACDVCGKGYLRKISLAKHRRTHGKGDPMESDRKTHSGSDENSSAIGDSPSRGVPPTAKSFECEICHRGYLREIDLNRHLRTHVSEEFRSLGCEFCEKGTTDTQRHLDEAFARAHPEAQRCHACKKPFSWMRQLRSQADEKKPGEVDDGTCILYKSVKNYGKKKRDPPQNLIKTEEAL